MSTTKEGAINGLAQQTATATASATATAAPTATATATATPTTVVATPNSNLVTPPIAGSSAAIPPRAPMITDPNDDIRGMPPKKPATSAAGIATSNPNPSAHVPSPAASTRGGNLVDAHGLDKKSNDEADLIKLAALLGENPETFIASQRTALAAANTKKPSPNAGGSGLATAASALAASYNGQSLLGDDDFAFVDAPGGDNWDADDEGSDVDLDKLPSLGQAKAPKPMSLPPSTASLASGASSAAGGGAGGGSLGRESAAMAAINALSSVSLMGGVNAPNAAATPIPAPTTNAPIPVPTSAPAIVNGEKLDKREKAPAPASTSPAAPILGATPGATSTPEAASKAGVPSAPAPRTAPQNSDELLRKTREMYAFVTKKTFFTRASADEQNVLKRRITTEISLYLKDPSKYPAKSPMEDPLNADIREAGGLVNRPVASASASAAASAMGSSGGLGLGLGATAAASMDRDMAAIYGGEDPQMFALQQQLELERIRNAQASRVSTRREPDEKHLDEASRTRAHAARSEVDELADILGEKPHLLAQNPDRVRNISTMAEKVCREYGVKHRETMKHYSSEMVLGFEKNATREVGKYLKNPATYPVVAKDALNDIIHEVGKKLGFAKAQPSPTVPTATPSASLASAASALSALNAVSLMGGPGIGSGLPAATPPVTASATTTAAALAAANKATTTILNSMLPAASASSRMDEKEDIAALAAACGMTPAELMQQRQMEIAHQQRRATGASGMSGGPGDLGSEFALRQAQLLRQSLETDAEPSLYGETGFSSPGLMHGYGNSAAAASAGASASTADRAMQERMATVQQMFDYMVVSGELAKFNRPSLTLLGERIIQEVTVRIARSLKQATHLKGWSAPDLNHLAKPLQSKVKTNSMDEINSLIAQMAGAGSGSVNEASARAVPIHEQTELATQMDSEAVVALLNAYRTGIVTYQPIQSGVDQRLAMGVKALLVGYLIGPFQLVEAGGQYDDYNKIKEVQDLLTSVPASALRF